MSARETQLINTLRIIACTTSDELTQKVSLDVLGESLECAQVALNETCYGDDDAPLIDQLRMQYA